MVFNNVCICGGGSLGHVVAGWLGGGGECKHTYKNSRKME